MTNKTVHVTIEGRVQGVWFRGWTNQQANALKLNGWVRNRREGSVEAVFSGLERDVDKMLTLCYDVPPAARVDVVNIDVIIDQTHSSFLVMPTGS